MPISHINKLITNDVIAGMNGTWGSHGITIEIETGCDYGKN